MPFNGSGVWAWNLNWVNDAANGIPITASRMDAQFDDAGNNGFDNCLTRDGQGSASANTPWNGFKITGVGLATTTGDALSYGRAATVTALVATTLNGNTFTTGTGTLTLGAGKIATISNTLTFTGTDTSSVNFGAGGTVLYSGGAGFVSSMAGTANEITASAATGAVTLSLPAALTFTGKTVTGGTFSGVALTTSTINGNNFTTGTGTLTLGASKTLTVSNTLTLAGTDSTVMTFPATSATIARTDAANTFTGVQTFSTPIATGSVATMTATVGGGVPTPPNNTTTFLRGDGTFAAVIGADLALTNTHIFVGNGSNIAVDVALSGDATMANTGAMTLATVNGNVGSFGSATASPTYTVNAKGLITAAANVTITPAVGSVTGLGTGVATALAVNTGSAGAVVLFNGAGGTPSSMTGTNISGTAASLTAGTASAVAVGGITGLGTGVATMLAATSSGTGGPMGTVSPTTTGTLTGAAANFSGSISVGGLTTSGTLGNGGGTDLSFSSGVLLRANSGASYLQLTTAGAVTLAVNSGVALTLSTTGVATIANLAGTGSRAVLADASGNLSAPVSNEDFKENWEPLDGLAIAKALKFGSFDWKKEHQAAYGSHRQIGMGAQSAFKAAGFALAGEEANGDWYANYHLTGVVALAAILQLEARVIELEKRL